MDNLEPTTIPIEDILLVTKNEIHLPTKNSLKELKTLVSVPPLPMWLYRWEGELFYVKDFYEIALQKECGGKFVNAKIMDANSKDEIVYLTLRNSFTNKVGIQKLNQFRFELIL